MDEKYSHSVIDSTKDYLYNLQYLGHNDLKTLKDIYTLGVICQVYNWADWFVVSEADKIKMQKLMDCTILRNSDLVLPTVIPSFFYSNVNTPQTIWTWQDLYNNLEVNTFEEIGGGTIPPTPRYYSLFVSAYDNNDNQLEAIITVNKLDRYGLSHGVTFFERSYAETEIVSLTASDELPDGSTFTHWNINGTTDTNITISVTMSINKSVQAMYQPLLQLGTVTIRKVVTNPLSTVRYGALYNWYAAVDARNLANTGWHVALATDFVEAAVNYGAVAESIYWLNADNTAGKHFKEAGTTHWISANGDNSSKFNGRGSGRRSFEGGFVGLDSLNFYIGTLPGNTYMTYFMTEESDILSSVSYAGDLLTEGLSVRLVKDSTTLTHGQSGTYVGNDGMVYRTICIGNKEWLADSLCETKYRNGDFVPVIAGQFDWESLTTGGMCYYQNDINYAYMDVAESFPVSISNGSLTLSGVVTADIPLVFNDVPYSTYAIQETLPSGYTLVSIVPSSIVLNSINPTQDVLITNDGLVVEPPQISGSITIRKSFGLGVVSDLDVMFNYTIAGALGTTYTGQGSVNTPLVVNGLGLDTYTISETPTAGFNLVSISPGTIILSSLVPNQIVTVYNERTPAPFGSITINKGFNNWISTSDMFADALNRSFSFTITGALGLTRLVATYPYSPLTITDLPFDTYTIVETPDAIYPLISITPSTVVIAEGSLYHTVNVLNTYTAPPPTPTGTITILKQYNNYLSTPGQYADALTVVFYFTVTGTGPSPYTITVPGNPYTYVSVANLPLDTYTITETPNATYPLIEITPSSVVIDELNLTHSVGILNTYNYV